MGYHFCKRNFVAGLGAVGVHRVEDDFSGAQAYGFFCPFQGVKICLYAAAVKVNPVAGRTFAVALCVHSKDNALASKNARALAYKVWVFDRLRVERDFFRPGQYGGTDVIHAADSAAHAKGNEDLACHFAYKIQNRPLAARACHYVVEDQLVNALLVVFFRHFNRVADVQVVLEFYALCSAAVLYVKANNDSFF